jgi:plastocyanin
MQPIESKPSRNARQPWTFNRLVLTIALFELIFALLVAGGFSPAIFLFVGPFLVPGIVLTALLNWRPKNWLFLAAGISISYLFFLFLPFIISGLSNPASPFEFAGYTIGLVSLFWSLPAGVIGFWRTTKGLPLADARSGWRTRQGIYSLAVAFIAVGAIVTSAITYAHASDSRTGGGFDFDVSTSVEVTTQNLLFNPSTFTVPVGTVTAIVVTNKDNAFHTFSYEVGGKTYSHDLLPLSTTKFLVSFGAPGPIPFWCIPHRAMGMTGTMTVS